METTVTVDFPKPVYQRLQRQSRIMQAPIAEIVVQTVRYSLPAWLDVIPRSTRKHYQNVRFEQRAVEKIAKSKLSITKQRKLDKLLEKNREDDLTPKELAELGALHLEANFLTLKKAQALALLKERGCKLPLLSSGK
jgi:hypothetical protein